MTFKNLAKRAKNRLQAASETKEKTTSRALSVRASYYISAGKTKTAQHDPLYPKIKKMLETNPDIFSPIGKLIDHSVFDHLSNDEKDKYLLDLTKRYHLIKAEIQNV
ncbi:MAG: hypothetical protein IJW24_04895 [Clostridia bacterium]|nr:hypothetical protein [Clostridia bacterium]